MERIIVQVEAGVVAELDALATDEAVSRAALVRHAIALLLAERRRRRELDAVISSYRAHPPEELVAPRHAQQRAWPD